MQNMQRQGFSPISDRTPEAELVSRAANGDERAFEAIMRRHNRMLFRTARSILKNDKEAEDALQESYLRAWRALSRFRSESKLSTWLVRIVANEAFGRLRRTRAQIIPLDAAMNSFEPEIRASLTEDSNQQPETSAMRTQLRTLMEAHIDRLPDLYRTIFILRAIEEMSVEEVSQALEIPEATVRTRFFRARGLLREGLSRHIDITLSDAFSFGGERCDRIVAAVLARANKR